MDNIFHSKQKQFDYANLGGTTRSGIPQVDSKSNLYNPSKQAKESGSKVKKSEEPKKSKKKEKEKVKQNVPQIGALGAFAALSGGMIGGVSMTATEAKPEVLEKPAISRERTPEPSRKPSVLSGTGEAEVDIGRKFSTQISTFSGADEEYEDEPTGNLSVFSPT